MSKILNLGKELIRISPSDNKKIEWSKDGKVWILRCNASYTGGFESLIVNGNEILAVTAKGNYYSKDSGRFWVFRGR